MEFNSKLTDESTIDGFLNFVHINIFSISPRINNDEV